MKRTTQERWTVEIIMVKTTENDEMWGSKVLAEGDFDLERGSCSHLRDHFLRVSMSPQPELEAPIICLCGRNILFPNGMIMVRIFAVPLLLKSW